MHVPSHMLSPRAVSLLFFYFLSRDCLLGSGDEWERILGLGSYLSLGLGLLLALVGDQWDGVIPS